MKHNELQEGKFYKIADSKRGAIEGLVFEISKGKLFNRQADDAASFWTESSFSYNFIVDADFKEHEEPFNPSKLKFNMLVFVKDIQLEDWKPAYFIEYVEGSALPFRVFDFGASAITTPGRSGNVAAYMRCKIPTEQEITEIFEANKEKFLGTKLATVKQES